MSDKSTKHPNKDQLTAFGLGTLDPSEAEKIAGHLDSCPACGETILSMQDDTFVSLVRNSPAPAPAENDSAAEPQFSPQVTVDVASGVTDSESDVAELPSELREHPRYGILELIGRGGMGEVYQAQHKVMNRIVALKVIKPQFVQNDAAVRRFHREVQAAARLNHPNIVIAYDAEQSGDLHFLVMEYVDGMDLSELVRRSSPLPIADACELIRQAALGLEHAHQHGLVHRDIKPSNLMLTTDGTVKILDLGLALLEEAQGEGVNALTTTGQTMGTLDYMAPEQGGDSHDVDIRTDIYALGATLYKLLTGEPIYAGTKYSNPVQRLTALALTPAPPIQSRGEGVPDELAAVVHKMIAKDRDERYATPGEVAEALAPFAAQANVAGLLAAVDANAASLNQYRPEPIGASPPVRAPQREERNDDGVPIARKKRQSRWLQNHVVWLATGGAALLVLLAAIVFFVQTNVGTIRIEINDPKIEVAIEGTEIVLKQADQGRDVRLSPGNHTLVIRRDDLQFETNKLILRRGDAVTVRVELLAGEVQVRQDEKLIGQRKLPPPLAVAPFDADQAKKHQQVWADYLGLPVEKEVELPGGRKLTMILIPPGEFLMGSTREEQAKFHEQRKAWPHADTAYNHIPYEGPQHLVRITRPFYLGKYEVTQTQWQTIMGRNLSFVKNSPENPVEQVSWDDIQSYLVKLNEAASAAETRFALPTEAQWEYACRAGTTTYWHSGDSEDTLQEYDWLETSSEDITHPVGQLKPNAFGLYDLHGNVAEWCADWLSSEYHYYETSPVDDPSGPSAGSARVYRGGHKGAPTWHCRSAWRGWYPSHLRRTYIGFRLAVVLADK